MPEKPPEFDENTLELQELIIRHGLAGVPAADLERLGYERSAAGSIVKKGVQAEQEAKRQEVAERWAEKERKAPFGEIRLRLGYQERNARRLDDREFPRFREMAETKADFRAAANEKPQLAIAEAFSQSPAFEHLAARFQDYFSKEEGFGQVWDMLYEDIFYWYSIKVIFDKIAEGFEQQKFLEKNVYRDIEELSSQQSDKAFQDLERLKGVATDRADFEKRFQAEVWDMPFPHIDAGEQTESGYYRRMGAYAKDYDLHTRGELAIHCFGLLLEAEGMVEVSAMLRQCDTLQAVREYLGSIKEEVPEDIRRDEKELREKMADAPIEDKKQLSQSLKEVRERKKSRQQLLQGLAAYFNIPEFGIEYVKREIGRLQDFLIRKPEEGEASFYLDGRPNKELDKDPGEISGDCTAGRPLAFGDPDYPIYNVKVFDEERDHIGNIYLFITQTLGQEKEIKAAQTVWHLDAIQIPSSINWNTETEKIIAAIGAEAEKKGVDFITINEDISAISNYDYIANAFLALWEHRGGGSLYILKSEPKDKKKYSLLQGDAFVRIVWARSPGETKA